MSSPASTAGSRRFFIVGAQRCGTTTLARLLDSDPRIELAGPVWPEPKFFLDEELVARGTDYYERTYFSDPAAIRKGEKGTSYIESAEAARRIARAYPAARILAIVREPVARAVSNYRFSVANGIEDLPVAVALTPAAEERPFDRSRVSVSPFHYLRRGRYMDYLSTWVAEFPRNRLHVEVLEELAADPSGIGRVFSFLGLEPPSDPAPVEQANASAGPPPDLPAELLRRLRESYIEPNRALERFLGRPLDIWG
jgi:hypothetical protein